MVHFSIARMNSLKLHSYWKLGLGTILTGMLCCVSGPAMSQKTMSQKAIFQKAVSQKAIAQTFEPFSSKDDSADRLRWPNASPATLSPAPHSTPPTETAPSTAPTTDSSPSEAERQKTVTQMIKAGDREYVQGNYEAAIALYTEALGSFNQNAYAYYNRANAYRKLKKSSEAIKDYSLAIRLNPSYMFAYLYRGTLLSESGDYQKAIADFSKGLTLSDQEPRLYVGRADAHRELKDTEAAIADYEAAIKLSKKLEKDRFAAVIQRKLQDVKRQQ